MLEILSFGCRQTKGAHISVLVRLHGWSRGSAPVDAHIGLQSFMSCRNCNILAHLSRRLMGELIVYRSSRCPSVRLCARLCVCVFTFSNMNISKTNGSIATKFYPKHHWGWRKAALGFGPDQIRTGFHGNRKLP